MQKPTQPIDKQRDMQISTLDYKGTGQTIKYMVELSREGQVSPKIRQYAESVIREIQPKDYMSEIAALYYDTCRTIRYTRDPVGAEYIQHPELVLQNKSADCDDIALYLNALLRSSVMSIGNDNAFTTVGFDPNSNDYTHVFLTAVEERSKKRVVLDPVAGPKTKRMLNQVKIHKHFNS